MEKYVNAWQTFNKRFDALFWENCHNASGQLCHIHRSEYGMDRVNAYLSSINFASMSLDLVAIKLDQLKAELEYLS